MVRVDYVLTLFYPNRRCTELFYRSCCVRIFDCCRIRACSGYFLLIDIYTVVVVYINANFLDIIFHSITNQMNISRLTRLQIEYILIANTINDLFFIIIHTVAAVLVRNRPIMPVRCINEPLRKSRPIFFTFVSFLAVEWV